MTEVVRGETDGKAWFQIIEPRWTSPKLWDTEANWNWVDACYSLYLKDVPPPRTRQQERVLKQLRDRLRVVSSEREELLGRIHNIETEGTA